MRVYQQVLDMGGAAVEQLEGVLGCTIQEAFVTYIGREGYGHPMDTRPGNRLAGPRPAGPPRHRLRLCRA
jgi:hypothetical protein